MKKQNKKAYQQPETELLFVSEQLMQHQSQGKEGEYLSRESKAADEAEWEE